MTITASDYPYQLVGDVSVYEALGYFMGTAARDLQQEAGAPQGSLIADVQVRLTGVIGQDAVTIENDGGLLVLISDDLPAVTQLRALAEQLERHCIFTR